MSTPLPIATSGHSKKVTPNAPFFLGYCVGNILGPQVFPADDIQGFPRDTLGS